MGRRVMGCFAGKNAIIIYNNKGENMKYSDEQLNEAVKNGIFAEDQIHKFREYVQNSSNNITKFQKVLYYGGGLLIISALTWLMGTS